MRATLRDVRRHPTWLLDWWIEWPARHWKFWRELLFERGQGWMRWGIETREGWEYVEDAHASYHSHDYEVAPPVRRVAMWLREWLYLPRTALRMRGEGLCWEEYGPQRLRDYWSMHRDEERCKELWRTYWRDNRKERALMARIRENPRGGQ